MALPVNFTKSLEKNIFILFKQFPKVGEILIKTFYKTSSDQLYPKTILKTSQKENYIIMNIEPIFPPNIYKLN